MFSLVFVQVLRGWVPWPGDSTEYPAPNRVWSGGGREGPWPGDYTSTRKGLVYGSFTLHGTGTGSGTDTIEEWVWFISQFQISVNISAQYIETHFFLVPFPVPVPCSVNEPLGGGGYIDQDGWLLLVLPRDVNESLSCFHTLLQIWVKLNSNLLQLDPKREYGASTKRVLIPRHFFNFLFFFHWLKLNVRVWEPLRLKLLAEGSHSWTIITEPLLWYPSIRRLKFTFNFVMFCKSELPNEIFRAI